MSVCTCGFEGGLHDRVGRGCSARTAAEPKAANAQRGAREDVRDRLVGRPGELVAPAPFDPARWVDHALLAREAASLAAQRCCRDTPDLTGHSVHERFRQMLEFR